MGLGSRTAGAGNRTRLARQGSEAGGEQVSWGVGPGRVEEQG